MVLLTMLFTFFVSLIGVLLIEQIKQLKKSSCNFEPGTIDKLELSIFALLFSAVTIVSILAAFQTGLHYLALIPFGMMIIYAVFINF